MAREDSRGRPLKLDPAAVSADPTKPAFLARPADAPVEHGFPVVSESETDGWVYGGITEFDMGERETEGDGFVVAPEGSRAGVAWALDTDEVYEISPPSEARWGVSGVRFPAAVEGLADLVSDFRAVSPHFQRKYRELNS